MIPLQLTLKNFLSYREAHLDFRELHTACICGANGAGKSSLLEAIGWALWGQSRASTNRANNDDDAIRVGADEVRVDFTFICDRQTYRVTRSRPRGKSPQLEFQTQLKSGRFRSLTAKGVRATQQKIIEALRLDYDTFVNSAYLRQGRADEFMLRTAKERKEVLASLLKLDKYEELADQAKDAAKQFKGRAAQIEQDREQLQARLAERAAVEGQLQQVGRDLKQLQASQKRDGEQLRALQARAYERQNWQQMLAMQQQQCDNLAGDCDRLQQDAAAIAQQVSDCQQLLGRRDEIVAGYASLQAQQAELSALAAKLQGDRQLEAQIRQVEDQLRAEASDLDRQLQQHQHRLESIAQQQRDLAGILGRAEAIAEAVAQLQQHRQRLAELDQLQLQVAPLHQRRNELQLGLEKARAQLQVKLEQLQTTAAELRRQRQHVPGLQSQLTAIQTQVTALQKQQVYLERVHEKGNQRRSQRDRLQADQQNFAEQLEALQQKLDLLQEPGAACPLCERPLDERHRDRVRHKTETEQTATNERILDLRGELAACDRELLALRREYKTIKDELAGLDALCQQQGQLEAQLAGFQDLDQQMQQCDGEMQAIARALEDSSYARELHAELEQLDRDLATLSYDEQTHSLVRGAVDRWRKAEFEQMELARAQRTSAQLAEQEPQVKAELAAVQAARETLMERSPLSQQIQALQAERAELGYAPDRHEQVQQAVQVLQKWQLPHHQLQQAEVELPKLQARQTELVSALEQRGKERDRARTEAEQLATKLAELPDCAPQIAELERHLGDRQQVINDHLAQQGALQQQLVQFDELGQRCENLQAQAQATQRRQRVYQELAQAFGKNGIQALMIENVLPQLEAQTNQILARLTGNQLHVQFLTQRAAKTKSRKQAQKYIDTLEILIADARGTRPYETYSGGEAFRINFAIRLALARLLAQRSGASLQMLIVDEGFGTQDVEGCDRLIAAINAIAADFACILTVTHMPQFKEAFQTRIEVHKTEQGSQLNIFS